MKKIIYKTFLRLLAIAAVAFVPWVLYAETYEISIAKGDLIANGSIAILSKKNVSVGKDFTISVYIEHEDRSSNHASVGEQPDIWLYVYGVTESGNHPIVIERLNNYLIDGSICFLKKFPTVTSQITVASFCRNGVTNPLKVYCNISTDGE